MATRPIAHLALPLTLALALAFSASAAASPGATQIGIGRAPTVAVDGAGTGYFAWNHHLAGLEDAVELCVLPRGASACSNTVELRPGGSTFSPPYVFVPSPGVVWVLAANQPSPDATLLYVSNDGGKSFGAPTPVGGLAPSGDAILGPGPAISVVTDVVTGTTNFQRDATDGSATGRGTSIGTDEYGGTIGLFMGQPVVAYWDFNSGVPNHVDYTAYKGSGDYNSAASWTAPAPVAAGSNTRIASGPAGLFLMYQSDAPHHYFVRKYTGTGFGPPVDIAGVENGNVNAFFEDGAGRLHAVWSLSSGALRYTASLDGVQWAPAVTAATDTAGIYHVKEAVAPDAKGWAVWDANSATGSVKVAPLDYAALSGGGGSAPGETSITVGSDVITLKTPAACVPPGTITAVLSVRSKKPKGHVVVKVKEADFSVDGKLKKRVKKAPFKVVLTITGLKSGSKHTLSAHVLLKSHHGPQRSRNITASFTIC
jgi:hypothetical protein